MSLNLQHLMCTSVSYRTRWDLGSNSCALFLGLSNSDKASREYDSEGLHGCSEVSDVNCPVNEWRVHNERLGVVTKRMIEVLDSTDTGDI